MNPVSMDAISGILQKQPEELGDAFSPYKAEGQTVAIS